MSKTDEMIVRFIIDYHKKNLFYPNYDEIAEGVGIAKNTVHTHMRTLEKEGIIVRKYDRSPQYRLIDMGFIKSNNQ